MAAHAHLLIQDSYVVRLVVGCGVAPDPRIEMRIIPLLSSRHPCVEAVNAELGRDERSPKLDQLVYELYQALSEALSGCDVAMVHNVHPLHKNLAFTAALARLHDEGRAPPLLAWAHDFAWCDPSYCEELHHGWPWSLLREPWPGVRYVAVSHDRRHTLVKLLGLRPSKITVVPPGIVCFSRQLQKDLACR